MCILFSDGGTYGDGMMEVFGTAGNTHWGGDYGYGSVAGGGGGGGGIGITFSKVNSDCLKVICNAGNGGSVSNRRQTVAYGAGGQGSKAYYFLGTGDAVLLE